MSEEIKRYWLRLDDIGGHESMVRASDMDRLVAKRDARIVELESQYQRDVCGLNNEGDPIGGDPAGGYANDNARLRAELAAIKAQEPVGYQLPPFAQKVIRKLERFQECTDDGQGADIGRHWFDLLTQLGLLNRVQRSPALWEITQQGEDLLAAAKATSAAPAADAGLSLIEWTKDAAEWGGALNYAAWEFVNECPEKSALLFNNTKGPLRAAIMKYAELVSANVKDSSHD